jgi:type I restriction enzyme R subunit
MSEESEYLTRKNRIDNQLKHLRWEIVHWHTGLDTSKLDNHAVEEFPMNSGYADYALFVKGRLLGIVEAKKYGVSSENVLEQAKRYSRGAEEENWTMG